MSLNLVHAEACVRIGAMKIRNLFCAAALLLLIPLAGCAKTLDSGDLEKELKTQLGKDAGATPKSVSCPDNIEVKKGKKFDCTLIAPNGDKVTVNVTLTNDNGGFTATVPPGQGG
jgi:hypothetical protein